MIRKDWSFCDQDLQFVATLHEKLNIFIFIFLTLILRFPEIFSIVMFHRFWFSNHSNFTFLLFVNI